MTSYVNSVQQVSITIPNGSTSATATITAAVGTAFIIYQGTNDTQAGTNSAKSACRVELTNSTTVTAFRNTSDTSTCTVNAAVVDATSSLVKTVQKGTITVGAGTTADATITAVTTANTAVAYLGYTTTVTSNSPITEWAALSLTTTTNVRATIGSSGGSSTVGYCVIEFQSAALASSVQAIADAASPASATRTKTITSVTTANTMLIWAGQLTAGGAAYTSGFQYATLTNATTITIGTQTAGFLSIQDNMFVVEFVAGVLSQNAQRGTISLVAATSGTATITSAATATTLANFVGNSSTGTTFAGDLGQITQTSATVITGTVNTAVTASLSWEALTFTGGAAETITLDKWFQRQENPILRPKPVPLQQYVQPQLTSFAETTLISKWEPYYPDRIDVRKPLVPMGIFCEIVGITIPEVTVITKWEPNYPDIINVKKPLNPSGYYVKSQFTTFIETIRPDKWYPTYPHKVYVAKPLVPEGYFTWPLGIALKENITLDKWEPYFPDRIDKKPRPVDTGLWAAIIGLETITLDKWKPTYSDIVWKFKPLVPEGKIVHPIGIITGENIIITDWEPNYPDKIDTKRPLTPTGHFATPIGIVSSPLWYPAYQDIIWRAKRPVDTGIQVLPQLISWAEKVSLDKWLGTYPDKVERAKTALTSPVVVEPFVLEVVTLDKWYNWQDNTPKRVGLFLNLTTGVFQPVFVPAVVPSTSTQIFWAITDDAFGLVFS